MILKLILIKIMRRVPKQKLLEILKCRTNFIIKLIFLIYILIVFKFDFKFNIIRF